jgi:poly-gamma-glutamate synthesis protein (capsule biosynthesis protein)
MRGAVCRVSGPLLLCIFLLPGCAPHPQQTIILALAGDVMLGRDVRRTCDTKGVDYPFVHVAGTLRDADLAFCNLESPLTGSSVRFPRVNALVGEAAMAGALSRAGFDIVSLANNHAIDAGRSGLPDTMALLEQNGIAFCGAGRTLAEAEQGTILPGRGLRVGFIAYSNFPYLNFVPDRNDASLLMLNEDELRYTIPPLAARSDVTIVSFHWGREGHRQPTDQERALAHLALDLGATLVVGHHAHVRGEIERYRGGLIAYCLGNLVFDEKSYGGNEGMILTCRAGRRGVEDYSVLPTFVRDCQAVPVAAGG